jgi:hypothetical protein
VPRFFSRIRGFHFSLLVLATGSAAYAVALLWLYGSFVDGHYLPVESDSFYHARRILDAMDGNFYQFDPRIHAPEGSWLTWPWAYDWLMAQAARALRALGGWDAMAILAHVAPAWTYVNAALLLALGVTLGLRPLLLALLGVNFAFSPLTQALHVVGMLDHHYVEYSFVLASLWSAILWMQAPASSRLAFAVGAVLGAAPAFHNGLFVLQLPVAVTLFVVWLRRGMLDPRATRAFAIGLAALTIVALLPSEPVRDGQFSFYTLSWFHAYVAMLTALGVLFLGWQRPGPRAVVLLLGAGAAASLPLLHNLLAGVRFLDATLLKLGDMVEAESVFQRLSREGVAGLARVYGAPILLLPLSLAWAVQPLLKRDAPADRLCFAVFAVLGVSLLCFQSRLHYFGSFVLVLPLLLWCQERAQQYRAVLAVALLAIAGSAVAAWPQLSQPVVIGRDIAYQLTRKIYPALAEACARRPGIVLADNNDGHYIRFHTECSVISDNFIMTPQHEAKLLQGDRLLASSSREIVEHAPYVDYLYVRRGDNFFAELGPALVASLNQGLRRELLFPGGTPAPELTLIAQLRLPEPSGGSDLLARVYRIDRRSPPPATASPPP